MKEFVYEKFLWAVIKCYIADLKTNLIKLSLVVIIWKFELQLLA